MSKYHYKIIRRAEEATYTVKKSKFIAYAHTVESPEEVSDVLESVKKLHHKARHFCYGYRLGMDQNNFRTNDDGEPSGTAGRPILGQIDSKGLTNTIVIVVRYFGGIKLGASGLSSAYKTAAHEVLALCEIVDKHLTKDIMIGSDHKHLNILMSQAKKEGMSIQEIRYSPSPSVILQIPLEKLEDSLLSLKAKTLGITTSEAKSIVETNLFHIFDEDPL